MKKTGVKVLVPMLFLLCMFFCSMGVFAADDRLGDVVDGSVLTDGTECQYTVQSKLRGTFLSGGNGTLSHPYGKKLNVSGSTICYYSCDKVRVTLHLQRLDGNSWVTIATVGPKTATNTYKVSASNSYTVTGGYYYRLHGYHVAFDNGGSEAVVSVTDGIWISK